MESTRLGGFSAILLGLCYVLTVIFVLLSPPGENAVVDHVTYMNKLISVHYILGFAGLFGIMAVLTISKTLEKHLVYSEWFPYTKVMAIIGFALLSINNFRQVGMDHELAHQAMNTGGTVYDTIVLAWAGLVELSPQGWIDFGFVGIWILTVSLYSLKYINRKAHSLIGIVGGSCFILTVMGNVFGVQLLVMFGMGLGGLIMVPLWFLLTGSSLIKNHNKTITTSNTKSF
ncbi:MAG TPA: hypothetical protein VEV44_19265 [Pseudoneobacillus sp.]|nr:hypothetical protein [Pseudoneobacillus sp.]